MCAQLKSLATSYVNMAEQSEQVIKQLMNETSIHHLQIAYSSDVCLEAA